MTSPRPSPTGGPSPLFIVLEGIDGSGTTTQLERVAVHLRARGRQIRPTREPSTGPVGQLLREILRGQHAAPDGAPVDGRTMALLFAADRRDHLAREIEPALVAGCDVVSDRYVLSSLAYQEVEAERAWVESLAAGIRIPDLTVLLDIPIGIAADRRRSAGRATERYDADRTLERVAENYRRLVTAAETAIGEAGPGPRGKMAIVDGARTVEEVTRAIAREVDRLVDGQERPT